MLAYIPYMDPMGNGKGKNGQRISDMIWIYLNHLERAPWRQDDSCERCERCRTIHAQSPKGALTKRWNFPNFDWRIWVEVNIGNHMKSPNVRLKSCTLLVCRARTCDLGDSDWGAAFKGSNFPSAANPRFEIIWQFRTLGNPTWETLGIYPLVN